MSGAPKYCLGPFQQKEQSLFVLKCYGTCRSAAANKKQAKVSEVIIIAHIYFNENRGYKADVSIIAQECNS